MRIRSTLFLASLLAFVSVNSAWSIDLGPGAVITPKAALPLRSAPPGGFIGLKGDTVGTVDPNISYQVIDKKSISTVFGSENWIKLKSLTNTPQSGWVFTGTKESPTANINVIK